MKEQIYHGFKLLHKEEIKEIKSTVEVFEHVKSGARLIHLGNNDDDKLFSIGFRTTPSNSTGVAHILEHSVLCGSKKFKTKNPFSDMSKSSLHTFMNAMTYTDKTIYPVGSRNFKDFMNLMDVYLDAVLNPRIYQNHNILKQEGWRYELDKDNKLSYKGVVYSEMQGALSSPEEIIINKIYESLLKNTTYQYVSGGDPEDIPNLTQEEFEEFHSKFYHPSNSYIYLYGDEDLDECLSFIDREYLSKYNKIEIPSYIDNADYEDNMVRIKGTYSINEDADDKNKEFFALNFAYENTSNALAYLTHKILYNLLIESPASPIKKELLKAGIGEALVTGEDMNMDPTKEILMPIVVKNAAKGEEEKFKDIILSTLKKLVKDGINRDLLESCINTIEFRLREITSYKGLQYNELVLESWLYDGDPTAHLRFDKTLSYLKEHIKDGYFENFINKNMIENKHCSLVVLSPEKGLAAKKAKKLEEKLENYKNSLSSKEIEKIREENELLKKEQIRKDTEEDKKTIPTLSLDEIDKKVEKIPQEVVKEKNITFLKHEIFTGNIQYINLLFDISGIEEKDISYLSLLSDVLGKVDTKEKGYSKLLTETAKVTGGINFNINVYTPKNNIEKYEPKFQVSFKAISENTNEALKLVNEILTSTSFKDVDRIHEVIKEKRANLELDVINRGNSFGIIKACSMIRPDGTYNERIKGESYFSFLCKLDKNFEEYSKEIAEKLNSIYNKVFNTNNLIVSLVGEENSKTLNNIDLVLTGLKNEIEKPKLLTEADKAQVVGIITNSNVQYVVKSYDVTKLGYNYSGKMQVMSKILDSEYLYPKVRLQGGAYGCYSYVKESGIIGVFSYRDPNLNRTIDVYNEAYKFLENLELSDRDMENFIIGTIGSQYRPLTPRLKGEKAVSDYICGISYEDNQKEKDEILNTTLEDIKSYSDMIKQVMDQNICCVVGNKENILKDRDKFNKINNI